MTTCNDSRCPCHRDPAEWGEYPTIEQDAREAEMLQKAEARLCAEKDYIKRIQIAMATERKLR